jgi:molybdopterin/thiamine biosynthesis adenylyltransferase
MTPPTKYALAGAGGIGCVLAPLLCRDAELLICDADSYEEKNHGRQFPSLQSTENKAKTLAGLIEHQTLCSVHWLPHFIKDGMITNNPEWNGVDMIVGAVDNNKSRRILVQLAEELEIPAILAGNEHEHGEAHLFIPSVYNPFDHHEFPDGDPAPWACNASQTLDAHPQTAIANTMAAAAAMHILLSWRVARDPLNCIVYSRLDPFSSDCRRAKNVIAAACAMA